MTDPARIARNMSNGLPRVDVQRDNGRIVGIYLDQFLIRGVRAVSYQEALSWPAVVTLEIVVDDIVVRDSGSDPVALNLGSLAVRGPEGGKLIGSEVVRPDQRSGPLAQARARAQDT